MPSKFVVRNFTEDSYYHIFNKGVEQRQIFLDEKDYRFFQVYLFIYLKPVEKVLEKYPDVPSRLNSKNLSQEVELIGYCLLPDHFHLLLRQKTKDGISKLMKQMTNAYTLYFNQKNNHSGGIMQGRYKAVGVPQDSLAYLLRYIHLNPVSHQLTQDLTTNPWSSYADYLGKETDLPCTKIHILSKFNSVEEFEKFHTDQTDYAEQLEKIKHLLIEI